MVIMVSMKKLCTTNLPENHSASWWTWHSSSGTENSSVYALSWPRSRLPPCMDHGSLLWGLDLLADLCTFSWIINELNVANRSSFTIYLMTTSRPSLFCLLTAIWAAMSMSCLFAFLCLRIWPAKWSLLFWISRCMMMLVTTIKKKE